jgi:hypothetical protein
LPPFQSLVISRISARTRTLSTGFAESKMTQDVSQVEVKVMLRDTVIRAYKGLLLSSSLWSLCGTQLLRHEIVVESGGVIFERSKYPIPELFVKWSGLKTEGVKECIGAAVLDGVGFGTLHEFFSKAFFRTGMATASVLTCSQAAHISPSKPPISSPFSPLRKKATGYHSVCPVLATL